MKNIFFGVLALFLTSNFYGQTLSWVESNYDSYAVGGNFVYGVTSSNGIDKLDLNGNLIQTFNFSISLTTIDGIAANSSDDFVISGRFVTTEDFDLSGTTPHVLNITNQEYYYAKYDANGGLDIVNTMSDGSGTSTTPQIYLGDIDLEDNGNFYLIGECNGTITYKLDGSSVTGSFTTDGQDVFCVAQGVNTYIEDVFIAPGAQYVTGICTDPNSETIGVAMNSFAPGSSITIGGLPYALQYAGTTNIIFTLSPFGGQISALEMEYTYEFVDIVEDIQFGPEGLIYICGNTINGGVVTTVMGQDSVMNNGGSDAFYAVVGLAGDGTFPSMGEGIYYMSSFGSADNEVFLELNLIDNRIYLLALTSQQIDFDNGPAIEFNSTYGDADITLVKLEFDTINFTETFSSLMSVGGLGDDFHLNVSNSLKIDANENIYIGLVAGNTIDLDPTPVTINYPQGKHLAKYNGVTSIISGNVYMDNNGNGIKDGGEQDIANVPIEIDNGSFSFFVSTDSVGNYSANVSIGSHTATPAYNNFYSASLPINNNVSVTASNTTYGGNDFGLTPMGNIDDLIIQINPLTPVRPGFVATYEVFYRNNGNTNQTGTVNFVMDSNFTYISSTVTPTAVTAPYISWDFFNMAPGTNVSMIVDVQVPANIGINVLTYCWGDVFSSSMDIEPMDNTYDLYQISQGSFDPNDKQVFPSSVSQAFVDSSEYLNYLIRFQNTGTDTAFTVIVRDTLDMNLQEQTLEIMSSSHTMVPTMYFDAISGRQIMEFKFNNILLPDSNVNEAASHGYLSYRVKLDTSFTVGSVATNTADIYFDFNAPVITNTTVTKINELVVTESILDALCNAECNGEIDLGVSGGLAPYYYSWSNMSGVTTTNSNLCAGEYHVQVWDSIGNVGVYTYQIVDPTVIGFTTTVVDASSSIANDGEVTITPSGGSAPYIITVDLGGELLNYSAGDYNICITDANGCSICDSVEVGINTGLNESSLLGNIIVAPNPATSFINIIYNENQEINVSLLNNMGQVISTQTITSNYQVDVSSLSQGIYFVKLESESEVVIKRIQVLK